MANVCSWVIIFRVLITFLDKWFLWAVPVQVNVIISGILELANGCTRLYQIENVGIRFLICSALVGFGGICVTMQTASVIGQLSLKHYLLGKVLQTVFSILLSSACQFILPHSCRIPGSVPLAALSGVLLLLILLFSAKKQKNSRIPAAVGV